jgi:hypothetical protein
MITFNIATIERRLPSFLDVLKSLAAQTLPCDCINIAFSYAPPPVVHEIINDCFKDHCTLFGNFTAAAKMFAFDHVPDHSYFLTFDDDIVYPPDYCATLVPYLDKYPDIVSGFHGMRFKSFPVSHFYDRFLYQYFQTVEQDQMVDVIGTGCSGFYAKTLRDCAFTYNYFAQFPIPHGNFNDMTFAQFTRQHHIPMMVRSHAADWLHIFPGTQDHQALWKISPKDKKTELLYLQGTR